MCDILETRGKAELYFSILWKTKFIIDELGYLVEEICKQNVEYMTWFLWKNIGRP